MKMNKQSLFIAILFAILISPSLQEKCGKIESNGYTIPHGDIVIEHGNPLYITCTYNKPLREDEELTFKRGNDNLADLVRKINETSIELYIEKVEKQDSTFICNKNVKSLYKNVTEEEFICINSVMVGSAPENITDFKCTSYNLDLLNCTWTAPKTYVKTNEIVRLIYPRGQYEFHDTKEDGQKRCLTLDQSTNPQYRRSKTKFDIGIYMENIFGNQTNNFTVENFKIVIPNPPENLTVTNLTTNSFYLQWRIPLSMRSFPPGITHKILYTCKGNKWQSGGIINTTSQKVIEFNLTGIPYPNSICEIAVSMKSAIADDAHWSKNASIFKISESTIPAQPPDINMGSFEISNPDSKFFVYWKQLLDDLQNGKDFKYEVEVEGHIQKFETTSNFHEFPHLPKENSYKIHIWSKNKIGLSKEKSTLYIPKQSDRVSKPTEVIRIQHKDYLELSWKPPQQKLTNYTVFFCESKRDRPYQCKGNVNWTIISPNAKKFNYTMVSENYQVGIAANSLYSSSGIVWASCTILNNGANMAKLHISKVGAEWISIDWTWECSTPSADEEYILTYCRIKSPNSTLCKDEVKEKIIKSPATQGNITDLMPYTTYLINVFIKSDSRRKQNDKELLNTTEEAAPNGRLILYATEVTNSSITVNWTTPDNWNLNGFLKYYYVAINGSKIIVDRIVNSYKFENLESYVRYNITVCAYTVACSKDSNVVSIWTLMGVPEKIKTPVSNGSNSTSISIGWDAPEPPRGKTDYYQVRIRDSNGGEVYKNVTSRIYTENCIENGNEFKVAVRAINVINGTAVYGHFSDELENYCQGKGTYIFYIILVVAVVLSFPTIYFIKWAYVKLLNMSDVKVELPDGLAQKGPKAKHNDDHEQTAERSSHDEQTLLLNQDNKKAVPASADSSGCSLGHESVGSSMESGQLSNTDSGTDQQRVNDEVRKTSLRQRNVPAKVSDSGLSPWGVTTPYIQVGDSEMPKTSSPYVQHGGPMIITGRDTSSPPGTFPLNEMHKTKNPGYVSQGDAFEMQPTPLPKGYVTTGFSLPAQKDIVVAAPQVDLLTATTPVDETPPNYVRAADAALVKPNLAPSTMWPSASMDASAPKTGYVSVGDMPAPVARSTPGGYVTHFDAKSGKND